MKGLKNKAALIIAAMCALSFSACTIDEDFDSSIQTTIGSVTTPVEVPPPDISAEDEIPDEPISLYDANINALFFDGIEVTDDEKTFCRFFVTEADDKVISDTSLEIDSPVNVRTSTSGLVIGSDNGEIRNRALDKHFSDFSLAQTDLPYEIESEKTVINFVSVTEKNYEIDSAEAGYKIKADISLNGFVRELEKTDEGYEYELIIDPAFMSGIPLYTTKSEYMQFDINGSKVMADTLSVICKSDTKLYDFENDGYIYAKAELSDFNCHYNTKKAIQIQRH